MRNAAESIAVWKHLLLFFYQRCSAATCALTCREAVLQGAIAGDAGGEGAAGPEGGASPAPPATHTGAGPPGLPPSASPRAQPSGRPPPGSPHHAPAGSGRPPGSAGDGTHSR